MHPLFDYLRAIARIELVMERWALVHQPYALQSPIEFVMGRRRKQHPHAEQKVSVALCYRRLKFLELLRLEAYVEFSESRDCGPIFSIFPESMGGERFSSRPCPL